MMADSRISALLDRLTSASLGSGEVLPDRIWERALLGPARELLGRPGKGFRGRLVEIGWALAGGAEGDVPAGLAAIIEIIHAGSLIVDDIQDGSHHRRGGPALHRLYPPEVALNTGNWLYFWPLTLLSEVAPALADDDVLRLFRRIAVALARCHQGQALDLTVKASELDAGEIGATVKTISRLKTGSLMGLAAATGAIAAGAVPPALVAIERLGEKLGVGLQMLDDLGSITSARRREKGLEDLALSRATWPWAWLAETDLAQFDALKTDDDSAAVLDALARRVGKIGKARVDAHLAQVIGLVEDAPAKARAALLAEIARLAESYDG